LAGRKRGREREGEAARGSPVLTPCMAWSFSPLISGQEQTTKDDIEACRLGRESAVVSGQGSGGAEI
jgi:hypothetical protein